MFKFKKVFLLSYLFFIVSCANLYTNKNLDYSSLLNNDSYIITATAIANTNEEARNIATNLLSQNIFVSVNSSFSVDQTLKNNTFKSNSNFNSSINSIGFFKNLVFSEPVIVANNKVKVSVGLSDKALKDTIEYLAEDLNIADLSYLTYYEIKAKSEKVDFLTGLLSYAKSKNININSSYYNQINSYKQALLFRISNSAKLIINVIPNINNATVLINNHTYKANEPIFLNEGTFSYTVSAKGYKAIQNKINLLEGDDITTAIYLQKKLPQPLILNLTIKNKDITVNNQSLYTNISFVLNDLQIEISKQKKINNLEIIFDNISCSRFGNSVVNTVPVQINFLHNNQIKISKVYKISYLSSTAVKKIPERVLISNLTKYLQELTAGDNLLKLISNS